MNFNWGNKLQVVALTAIICVPFTTALPRSASADDIYSVSDRIMELEEELRALREELARVQQCCDENKAKIADLDAQNAQQHQEMTDRIGRVEREIAKKKNMVFFRGGYADMDNDRSGQVFSDLFGFNINAANTPTTFNDGDDGWYVGAGIEHSVTEDLFGLYPATEVLAEIMFEWKRWQSKTGGPTDPVRVVPGAVVGLVNDGTGLGDDAPFNGEAVVIGRAAGSLQGITMSQFTLSAAPKIKLLNGSPIRPWIIPAGLAFHVISPPSDAGTVLTPGVMFGAGVDWQFFPNMYLGIDGRYHLSGDEVDGVDADHYTVGGYLGLGF